MACPLTSVPFFICFKGGRLGVREVRVVQERVAGIRKRNEPSGVEGNEAVRGSWWGDDISPGKRKERDEEK